MPQWEYKIIDLGSARAEQGEIILRAYPTTENRYIVGASEPRKGVAP
jgi:hypothetical protein